jgi:CBS domain containing-hemolysin-like protein
MNVPLQLIAVVVLLAVNSLFVLAEFALASVRRGQVEDRADAGNRRARLLLQALDDLDRFVPAVQLGITMSSIALGWIGVPALAALIEPALAPLLGEPVAFVSAVLVAFLLAFLLLTLLHVILAEILPRSVALQYPEALASAAISPVRLFLTVFRPLILLSNAIARQTLRLIGVTPSLGPGRIYTEDELRNIVAASRQGGELVKTEADIIRRAFVFHDYTAESIMVPRTELVALPVGATLSEMLDLMTQHKFGRYPVFGRDLDDILGILYVKELVPAVARSVAGAGIDVEALMRSALTVPTSIPIDALLEEMRSRGTHVAIVVDEYGGTAGMVTLDDILERVLGEVPDEFEPSAPDIVQEPDGWARVDGLTLLSDVNEYFHLDLEADETNTIGGYVFFELGHQPRVGDTVTIDGYAVRVEALDGLRIAELRFIPTDQPPVEDDPSHSEGANRQG